MPPDHQPPSPFENGDANKNDAQKEIQKKSLQQYLKGHFLQHVGQDKRALAAEYGVSDDELDAMAISVLLPMLHDPNNTLFVIHHLESLGLQTVLQTPEYRHLVTEYVQQSLKTKKNKYDKIGIGFLIDCAPYLETAYVESQPFRQMSAEAMRHTFWSQKGFYDQYEEIWNDEKLQYNLFPGANREWSEDQQVATKIKEVRAQVVAKKAEAFFQTPEALEMGYDLFLRRLRQGFLASAVELSQCFDLSPVQMRAMATEVAKRLLTDENSMYNHSGTRDICDALEMLNTYVFSSKDASHTEWRETALLTAARVLLGAGNMRSSYESHADFLKNLLRYSRESESETEDESPVTTEEESQMETDRQPLIDVVRQTFGITQADETGLLWQQAVAENIFNYSCSGYRMQLFEDLDQLNRTFGAEVMESKIVQTMVQRILLENGDTIFEGMFIAILPFIHFFHLESACRDKTRNRRLINHVLACLSDGEAKGMKELVDLLSPPKFWLQQSLERGIKAAFLNEPKHAKMLARDFSVSDEVLRSLAKESLFKGFNSPISATIANQVKLSPEEIANVINQAVPEKDRPEALAQFHRWTKKIPRGEILWLRFRETLKRIPAQEETFLIASFKQLSSTLSLEELLDRGYTLISSFMNADMRQLINDEKDLDVFLAWMRTHALEQLTYFLQRILRSTNPAIQKIPLSAHHLLSSFVKKYPLSFELFETFCSLHHQPSLTDEERNVHMTRAVEDERLALESTRFDDEPKTTAEKLKELSHYFHRDQSEDVVDDLKMGFHFASQEQISRQDVVQYVRGEVAQALSAKEYGLAAQMIKIFKLKNDQLIAYAKENVPSLLKEERFEETVIILEMIGDKIVDTPDTLKKIHLSETVENQFLEMIRTGRMETALAMYNNGLIKPSLPHQIDVYEKVVKWAATVVEKNDRVTDVLYAFGIPRSLLQQEEIQKTAERAVRKRLEQKDFFHARSIAHTFGLPPSVWETPEAQQQLADIFIEHAGKESEDRFYYYDAHRLLELQQELHLPPAFLQSAMFQDLATRMFQRLVYDIHTSSAEDGKIKQRAFPRPNDIQRFLEIIPFDRQRATQMSIDAALRLIADGEPEYATELQQTMGFGWEELQSPSGQSAGKNAIESAFNHTPEDAHDHENAQMDVIKKIRSLTGLDDALFEEPRIKTAAFGKIKRLLKDRLNGAEIMFGKTSLLYDVWQVIDACHLKDEVRAEVLAHPEEYLSGHAAEDLFQLYEKLDIPREIITHLLLETIPKNLQQPVERRLNALFDVCKNNAHAFHELFGWTGFLLRECPWVMTEAFEPILRTQGNASWQYMGMLFRMYELGAFATTEDAHLYGTWMEQRPEEAKALSFALLDVMGTDALERPLSSNAWLPDYLERCDPNAHTLKEYAAVMRDPSLSPEERAKKINRIPARTIEKPQMDPFDILGVTPSASDAEIKKSYRRLARLHHPDKGGDAEMFKQIHAAYQEIMRHRKTNPRKKSAPEKLP